jgi:ribA/ribD-fused uncharacterized protein
MTINEFQGEYRFLSNFWPLKDGKTVEHYFQSSKTLSRLEWWRVYNAETPGQAKRLGRTVTLREDWDDVKNEMMLNLLRVKFSDPELGALLVATGDEELIEGNHWGDTYWGVDLKTGEGDNFLGRLLMKVREEVRTNALPVANLERPVVE